MFNGHASNGPITSLQNRTNREQQSTFAVLLLTLQDSSASGLLLEFYCFAAQEKCFPPLASAGPPPNLENTITSSKKKCVLHSASLSGCDEPLYAARLAVSLASK